ncbi:MAG TPA: hypothetical protein PLP05_05070, partial [Sedimentisphaerales bacterium]|nr:hypothetical protein [Sedimentisphaerales bacterium]
YRSQDGQQTGSSKLRANLRLDPCIALRTGQGWTSEPGLIVTGDVYSKGYLAGEATIKGDAFAGEDIYATVNITGSENEENVEIIPFPAIDCGSFRPLYYIGSNSYSPYTISNLVPLTCVSYTSSVSNPKGVYYCNGSLILGNSANIYGTLVVNGNLTINGTNVIISAKKNFPALIVTGKLKLVTNSHCVISGLVQIGDEIEGITALGVEGGTSITCTVNGSVFIKNYDIDGLSSPTNTLRINAWPDKSAIELWNSSGTPFRWNCTGGAFYKSIVRY